MMSWFVKGLLYNPGKVLETLAINTYSSVHDSHNGMLHSHFLAFLATGNRSL